MNGILHKIAESFEKTFLVFGEENRDGEKLESQPNPAALHWSESAEYDSIALLFLYYLI